MTSSRPIRWKAELIFYHGALLISPLVIRLTAAHSNHQCCYWNLLEYGAIRLRYNIGYDQLDCCRCSAYCICTPLYKLSWENNNFNCKYPLLCVIYMQAYNLFNNFIKLITLSQMRLNIVLIIQLLMSLYPDTAEWECNNSCRLEYPNILK